MNAESMTVGGWTATGRFLGRCTHCATVIRQDRVPCDRQWDRVDCPGCARRVLLKQVFGCAGEARCDDRCRYARGPDCACSCAGVHHGEAL